MAYHNGAIWPHDNALVAAGLARYGFGEQALQIWTALFEASMAFDLHRMPELFCGFPRAPGEGPVLYPVACAPQAWSAASVFLLFQACLGLEVQRLARSACTSGARGCPPRSMSCASTASSWPAPRVDLLLLRHDHDVGVTVVGRDGEVEVLVVK